MRGSRLLWCAVIGGVVFGVGFLLLRHLGIWSPVIVGKPSFRSSTYLCDFNSTEFQAAKRSQFGEDQNLLEYFQGRCGGTYVELGALDGQYLSNTYAFHKALSWKGVLVELVPASFAALKVNRPHELAVVHAAVCAQKGTVHFVTADNSATSGVWEFSAPSFRKAWWPNLKLENTVSIDCLPLQTILSRVSDNFYADFFSLDVEGGELTVLQSIDFHRAAFGIVIVEADEHSPFKNLCVQTFLASKGYPFLKRVANSDWFVNSEFASFYADGRSSKA